jgi:hypothetical protein
MLAKKTRNYDIAIRGTASSGVFTSTAPSDFTNAALLASSQVDEKCPRGL